ncbi:MAG: amidohydrolase family protein [Armatimonadia bacterium]|nr:amidohydrolase family protein [Armatimonadia bacterium]
MTDLQQRLFDALRQAEVIDAHEHLFPEKERVALDVDATMLFSHYCETDLITSGMPPEDFRKMKDLSLPADYRWSLLSPHLPNVRHGSYARAGFLAARELWGFEDIGDANHAEVTAKMREHNTPGLYRRILRDKCNIRRALTQCGRTDVEEPGTEDPLLIPVIWLWPINEARAPEAFQVLGSQVDLVINTVDDLVEAAERRLVRWKEEGAVGVKLISQDFGDVDRAEAVSLFGKIRAGTAGEVPANNPLRSYITYWALKLAAKHNLTVAVHTGMWGDFRTLDPKWMIPVVERHRETRFDIYHAGMPWVRETGVIGKNNPNVWLNLCWCHIISQRMTVSLMDEWMDLVPINKILGFGGDYNLPVEKVVGHHWMAMENLSEVLSARVERGHLTEDQALEIGKMWLFDNAKNCYPLLPV